MNKKIKITRQDIIDMKTYSRMRAERRKAMIEIKRYRRVGVGPDATFYFENYETMWHQVHEMLFVERGGEAQIKDELSAYNPMIPQGAELVATLMFEIDDEIRRQRVLGGLGGIARMISLLIDDETIPAIPEDDIERTNEAGKASSVHFLHFPFSVAQIAKFRDPSFKVVIGINHPTYGHQAILSEATRQALAADLDG